VRELENIVSKIPGSSRFEDAKDWLNCDSVDPGHHIMTDEEITDNLKSEEVTEHDNRDDIDEEEREKKTFLHTAMIFKLWT
jgi:hypothetical protein